MGNRSYRFPDRDFLWVFLFIFFYCFSMKCNGVDRIQQGELIRDGETIISEGLRFELGFFSPGDSLFRYVGIWYYGIPIQSVIWVANRENPISGEGGVLTIGRDGNLTVLDGDGIPVWSSNACSISNNSTAILVDSGDLILSRGHNVHDPGNMLWESFKNPSDSYLPGMRVYVDSGKRAYRVFSSWKSASDPSPGNYSMGIDPHLPPQIVIWEGQKRRWRSGHWIGLMFTGVPDTRSVYLYGFHLISEGDKLYFTYTLENNSESMWFLIGWNGTEMQLRWNETTNNWSTVQTKPSNECEIYNRCGAFGKCNMTDSVICSCIEGFRPSKLDQWNQGNGSGGCVRRKELKCERNGSITEGDYGDEDVFKQVDGVKLPDFLDSFGNENKEECEAKCLKNCSCVAYASVDGLNCMIWSVDLVDIEQFATGGNTLYVRLAHSELGRKKKVAHVIIILLVVAGSSCLTVSVWLFMGYNGRLRAISNLWITRNESSMFEAFRTREYSTDFSGQDGQRVDGQQGTAPEFAMFSFSSVDAATNNFSDENKLGQGGFGPVYKGTLPGGQEIAVKRLSRRSGQGLEELKNEITLIARLQHRNLVRLLGCCIEREEKMLLYEYMPNKSLDSYLFDSSKQAQLDWRKRFTIIEGIARGLLYLHRDSRLRVIHRDLKASNILLDDEMNPKISDFGMARIFGRNQDQANTVRVVGTYGYMSPEYAMEGLFSVKSDVYSFGVLLLEIVSGRRNSSFREPEYSNIIGHAWDLWDHGKALDFIDPSIAGSCCPSEVLKCIHVGMLCVQDMASHRPNMSSVILMLESESVTLPMPRQPTFTSMKSSLDADYWDGSREPLTSNDVTISTVVGR